MLNQFVGVGRLVAEPSVKETEDGKQKVYVYDRKGNETEYTGSNK